YPYTELTARELDDESNRVARGLQQYGIGRGARTVLMVTPSVEFFVLTFALFKAGAVPVMVDPGMGVRHLKTCLDEAAPGAFIGIPKAHAARVLLGWARSAKRLVTVGRRIFWGGATLAQVRSLDASPVMAETGADEMAAILFTSGSTGTPKGAVYTHGIFEAQVRALREHYRIEPGERDLATFPLFALFGPALGMASIVPNMDASRPITADPRNLAAAIKDYKTTNIFASPALIDVLGRYGETATVRLDSVRRVISAGAPADLESLERFAKLLPEGVEVFPSYGATEALPLCSIGSAELLSTRVETESGKGICVGRPIRSVELAVIDITDDAIGTWSNDLRLPPGAIGEICVQGQMVTRAYFNRDEATRHAKIPDGDAVWHRMGDVGYLDATGRLWYCGRKGHRVELDHETLYSIPVERVLDTHPKVRRTALVGVDTPETMLPVLCVELRPEVDRSEWTAIRDELGAIARSHDHTKRIETFL
ncbi:MAG: fatty acid CoA ligase family protein, partial [Candidatus Hydrogenedentota bacterium]